MSKYGETIQRLRREANLTQSELGEKLNVSSQAVSKWENDFSQPDFDTIKKLCGIFNISVDKFADMVSDDEEAGATAETSVQSESVAEEQPTTQPTPPQPVMLGVCKDCGISVYEFNRAKEVSGGKKITTTKRYGRSGHHTVTEYIIDKSTKSDLVCKTCNEKRLGYEKQYIQAENRRKEQERHEKKVTHGWYLFGLICAIVVFVGILTYGIIDSKKTGSSIVFPIILAYSAFAVVALIGHDTVVGDILVGGLTKSIHLPGIIFSLDLDSILFAAAYKFIIAPLVSFLLWLLFFFGAIILSLFVAFFIFPFKIPSLISDLRD